MYICHFSQVFFCVRTWFPVFFFASARGSLVSAVEDEEAPKSIWDQSGFMLARLLHWLTVEPGF